MCICANPSNLIKSKNALVIPLNIKISPLERLKKRRNIYKWQGGRARPQSKVYISALQALLKFEDCLFLLYVGDSFTNMEMILSLQKCKNSPNMSTCQRALRVIFHIELKNKLFV